MNKKIDVVNEQGEIVTRSSIEEVHKKGLLHKSVHIFIIDSQGRLFCRQISLKKRVYSGWWSTSVGAHVLSGQTCDQVAQESLLHNLGINCKLRSIGKIRVHDQYENEISETYIGFSDKPMSLNKKEIEDGKFLTVNNIKELIKQENVTPHLVKSLEIYLRNKQQHQSNGFL